MNAVPVAAERPLRLGLLCPGEVLPAAFAAAVRELLDVDGVELVAVIAEAAPPAARPRRLSLWEAYLRRRPRDAIASARPVDLSDAFAGVARVEAGDVATIRDLRLDVVLRHGSGAPGAELLDAATHGVWAFHRSDDERFRDQPPGFGEVARGEPATGAILQRLTQRPDAGLVLQRCFVSTNPASHRATLDAVAWASTHMPARVARDLLNGCASYLEGPPVTTGQPVVPAPSNARVLRFLSRAGGAWIRAQLVSIFLIERWYVGVVRSPIASFLAPGFQPEIEWLAPRRGGFLADPFLVADGIAPRMLMEEWDDRTGRGTIAEVDLEAGLRGTAPRTVLDEGTHLAYPFVLEHEGRLYCIPENHQRRGVFLYEIDAAGRWHERATLLDGVAAVDPTLVRHDGRWWLFHTDEDRGPEVRLFLWSAPELLGPWEPHPANPVKADVRSSRPAGTPFAHEGALYRPAQDCAGGYGRAVVINRVTRLTATEYAEEAVARFGPPPGSPYRDGFHTLAGLGDLTAVDGKRMAPAPRLVIPRLAAKLRRLAGRARP